MTLKRVVKSFEEADALIKEGVIKEGEVLILGNGDSYEVISFLPTARFRLAICKQIFSCYKVSVTNNLSNLNNVKVSIGKSRLGERFLDSEKENFGITIRPNETYNFKYIKCFFDEELFIESTDKNVTVCTTLLKECPNPQIVTPSSFQTIEKMCEGGLKNGETLLTFAAISYDKPKSLI